MYIKSNRGGEKFISDGYMYVYDKTSSDGNIKFWRCEFKNDKCRARIHTSVKTNEILKKMNEHKHEPNPERIIAIQMRNLCKRKAEALNLAPEIKFEMMDSVDEEYQSVYEPIMHIKEEPEYKVQRKKKDDSEAFTEYVDIPKDLETYELVNGKRIKFLLDDHFGTNEILIFGREDFKDWAHFMKTIYIDSTFKSCPSMYSQICVIMTERNGFIFSVLYVFLRYINEESYEQMFQCIKKVWPTFDPRIIYTDFMKTSYSVLSKEFPTAEIRGNFHFLKMMFLEKVHESGLIDRYHNNMEFSIQTKIILAVTFVPENDIEDALNVLRECLPKDLIKVLNWFEETFVGKLYENKHLNTRICYPRELWSMHDKVTTGLSYWNYRFESTIKQVHEELESENVLVSQYITGFQQVQRISDSIYDLFIKGEEPMMQSDYDRIVKLVSTYKERTLYEFMRGVAVNIY